jgi:Pyridoxal-dependent decarboxylase conserved domain
MHRELGSGIICDPVRKRPFCARHPIIYHNSEAHYCVAKNAWITGLQCVSVNTLSDGSMDTDLLAKQITDNKDSPAIVVATCGTTVREGHDDIAKIIATLKGTKVDYYVHVDDVLCGMTVPSLSEIATGKKPTFRHGVNSISMSLPKFPGGNNQKLCFWAAFYPQPTFATPTSTTSTHRTPRLPVSAMAWQCSASGYELFSIASMPAAPLSPTPKLPPSWRKSKQANRFRHLYRRRSCWRRWNESQKRPACVLTLRSDWPTICAKRGLRCSTIRGR